jgi:hypothetical protein
MVAIVALAGFVAAACAPPPPPPPPGSLDNFTGAFQGETATGASQRCAVRSQVFDATYPVRAAAKEVVLHVTGCITPPQGDGPGSFTDGIFTATTDQGFIHGTASGPVEVTRAGRFDYLLDLVVTRGGGAYASTRGTLNARFEWFPNIGTSPFNGVVWAG